MNINPFLLLLALVSGFAFSWYLVVVKSVDRHVLAPRTAGQDALGGDWLARLDAARDRLVGATDELRDEATQALGRVRAEIADRFDGDDAPAPPAPAVPVDPVAEPEVVPTDAWAPAIDPDPVAVAGAAGATAANAVLPPSASAPEDGSTPAGYTVKGDIKASLYLLPDDADYDRARPDIWFVDEAAALDAGYAHYIRRSRDEHASEPVQDALPDHPGE